MINIKYESSIVVIDERIILSPTQTKKKVIDKNYLWEVWLKNDNDEVVSYRVRLGSKKDQEGYIYIIVTFSSPINDDSLLCSWVIAPENLIEGNQKKIEGKVTKKLRDWFYNKTGTSLPIGYEWGHIDASYDPWNKVGMIYCNYRTSFESELGWEEYRALNKF